MSPNNKSISPTEIIEYLKICGTYSQIEQKLMERKNTVIFAKQNGIDVTDAELQETFEKYRKRQGMIKASTLNNWLSQNNLTLESVESFVETDILIDKLKDMLEKGMTAEKMFQHEELRRVCRTILYQNWLLQQNQ